MVVKADHQNVQTDPAASGTDVHNHASNEEQKVSPLPSAFVSPCEHLREPS
jgi:hypothetical protein